MPFESYLKRYAIKNILKFGLNPIFAALVYFRNNSLKILMHHLL